MNQVIKCAVAILIPLIVGGISGFFTTQSVQGWYATVNKPWFNPPNWIFGPVWTTLYIMMGVAFFLIWKSEADIDLKKQAMLFYFVQLALNFCWSLIFFYAQQPGWAFLEIIAMGCMIIVTIIWFGKISSTAAWLLVPYISWVSFAAILNYSIWRLNV